MILGNYFNKKFIKKRLLGILMPHFLTNFNQAKIFYSEIQRAKRTFKYSDL